MGAVTLPESTGELREDQGGVGPAEAERVAHHEGHLPLASLVWNEIERTFWVLLVQVDRGWQDAGVECLHAHRTFHRSGRAEQVAHHALGRADPQLFVRGMAAEH